MTNYSINRVRQLLPGWNRYLTVYTKKFQVDFSTNYEMHNFRTLKREREE